MIPYGGGLFFRFFVLLNGNVAVFVHQADPTVAGIGGEGAAIGFGDYQRIIGVALAPLNLFISAII
jgi:hypothetical protein